MDISKIIANCISGTSLSLEEAIEFLSLGHDRINDIVFAGGTLRQKFRGNKISTCTIINAKSGKCSENCRFCAQSAHHRTNVETWELQEKESIAQYAKLDEPYGGYFGIVTSGKRLNENELEKVTETLSYFKTSAVTQEACASLGILEKKDFEKLKEAGLRRYHHNLEVSRNYFPQLCTTHSWEERKNTILAAKEAGLSICVGGIFGVGESIKDRVELLFEIAECDPDSVPLNFLVPIKGTPMENMPLFPVFEAVKIIALTRLIMPLKDIKVGGGRVEVFKDNQALPFLAGASSMITGQLLTVKGVSPDEDMQMLEKFGFVRS
jgi:biotin synthase